MRTCFIASIAVYNSLTLQICNMSNSDRLLSENDRKSQLSVAYALAVAARAGYSATEPRVDRDSVDMTIEAGGGMRPKLDVQLKATSTLTWKNSSASFVLKRKNYDDLRAERMLPIILLVLELPKQENEWLTCDTTSLILRRSAFWLSLAGVGPIDSDSSTVHLLECQRFDPESLRALMMKARNGHAL